MSGDSGGVTAAGAGRAGLPAPRPSAPRGAASTEAVSQDEAACLPITILHGLPPPFLAFPLAPGRSFLIVPPFAPTHPKTATLLRLLQIRLPPSCGWAMPPQWRSLTKVPWAWGRRVEARPPHSPPGVSLHFKKQHLWYVRGRLTK